MSGGVGITPMMGMLLHFIHLTKQGKLNSMKKVYFVWTVREQSMADNMYQEFFLPLLQNELTVTAQQGDDWRVKESNDGLGPVFEFNFHVTGKSRKVKVNADAPRKPSASKSSAQDSGVELEVVQRDPEEVVEEHKTLWKADRPNLPELFADASKVVLAAASEYGSSSSSTRRRISASVCGPRPLVEAMRTMSEKSYSCFNRDNNTIAVDLHEELFNF